MLCLSTKPEAFQKIQEHFLKLQSVTTCRDTVILNFAARKCQKRLKHQRLSALRALRHGFDAVRGQASEEPPVAAAPDAAAIAAPGEVAPEAKECWSVG